MQQQKKFALLSWLSKILHIQIHQPSQLRSGQYLVQLCNKIPGISINLQSKYQGWKDGYLRLKSVYEEISSFMKNVIKYQFPNAIEIINLVEMAKGQDDEGLMSLLNVVFLVSFNLGPENSQIFVQKAMVLSVQYQNELCDIVRDNPVPKYEQQQMEQYQEKYQKQRQKVSSLINAFQSLTNENDSLRQALISQAQQNKKLSDHLKKVQQQKQKLKKQLLQNYKMREQQQNPKNSISQHHQQMVQLLKSDILQMQKNHSQQMFELNSKIQSLEEQLDIYKSKVSQLEENNVKGIVDHSNCINLQLYKKEKNQFTAKLTQASSKEWKTKLENIRLQNLTEQLKEKNKKLIEESKNKENSVICSKNEANRLRLQFYTQIRDKLKKKIQNNPVLSNQPKKKQSQDIQRIILDDPQIN